MIKLINFIILLIFFLSNNVFSYENKIIFKINNKSFTSLDYENRKNYLKFIGDNSDLKEIIVLNDFISANIFYEYYLDKEINYDLENRVIEIYNNIKEQNKNNNRLIDIVPDIKNIKKNLELDLIRKNILEEFLNSKRNEIINNNEEIDLLYKFNIEYINFYLENKEYYEDIKKLKDLNEIKSFLKNKNIIFKIKKDEIKNINAINSKIKNYLNSKENFLIINNSNMYSAISITKSFETYEGMIARLFSLQISEKLNPNKVNCSNFKNNMSQIETFEVNEYEYIKLNDKLKKNLLNINDYVIFSNNQKFTYIILCGLKFDQDVLNNININKKINSTVDIIESEFILKYSKKYELVKFNE